MTLNAAISQCSKSCIFHQHTGYIIRYRKTPNDYNFRFGSPIEAHDDQWETTHVIVPTMHSQPGYAVLKSEFTMLGNPSVAA